MCLHEQSAAFMAQAIGRLTGTPGTVLTTSGPGPANCHVWPALATTRLHGGMHHDGDCYPSAKAGNAGQSHDGDDRFPSEAATSAPRRAAFPLGTETGRARGRDLRSGLDPNDEPVVRQAGDQRVAGRRDRRDLGAACGACPEPGHVP